MTLQQLAERTHIPTSTAWYLADLGEARGKQELFTRQSPQRLKGRPEELWRSKVQRQGPGARWRYDR